MSCLMVLTLILASCSNNTESTAGSVSTQDQGQTVTGGGTDTGGTVTTTTTPSSGSDLEVGSSGPEVTVAAETNKPQYGGTLTYLTNSDITTFNPGAVVCSGVNIPIASFEVEQILGIAFDKGPAGTGETNFIGGVTDYRYLGGNICESWETPAVGVWVLNIRQGIYWYNNPGQAASQLVGGRELTAEDVAYSIEYMRDNPTSSSMCSEPTLLQNCTVDRNSQWQITVNTPVAPTTGYLWIMGGGGVQYVWPKEFLQQYATSNNWYDVVGSGPYMMTDYVPSVAAKLVRNDNYWDVNPVGPGKGDQLPYIDKINYQIIPDASTRESALRTGKADWSAIDLFRPEQYDTLVRANPDIKSVQTIQDPQQVSGRVDLPDNPFSKLEVRQAMMLAIDQPSIVRDFYNGKAEILDSPARKWYTTIYTPLDQLPESTQELFGYDPAKAKQLLADAGYPNGFKMKMVMSNTPTSEEASAIIKEYWAAVGIDVELSLLEPTSFISLWVGHKSEDLVLSAFPGGNGSLFVRYSMGYYRGPNIFNLSHVDDPPGSDPIIEQAFDDQSKYVMVDYPQADAVTKEAYKYCLSQAFNIQMPAPWVYRVWQPWVKNYYGAGDPKFWVKWAFIDQDLKASMQ